MYKRQRQNGAEVTPVAVGTYEVWVRLTNDNYCHLDGSMERQIGTFKISTGKPTYYTLTLKSGGGEQMTMPVAGGSTVVLPENSFERTGLVFIGWKTDRGDQVYQPGESVSVGYGDLSFTAQWRQANSALSGTVTDADGEAAERAVVTLWRGANKMCIRDRCSTSPSARPALR